MQSRSTATARSRRRHGFFSGMMAFSALLMIALAIILNGCGGSGSSQSSISVPPPSGTPSVSSVASTGCTTDFFSDVTNPAVCSTAILTGCPNASPLTFTFSYDLPATTPKGTIVFFAGGDGTGDAGDVNAAGYYFSQGFEVIQVEWSYDWEVTDTPTQFNGGVAMTTYPSNVQLGACRGATFLNYVFNMNNTSLYSAGGRCAQGSSAGSGMIAYALTYYGAANYLDAVELKSGPPIADFEQGCEEPPAPDVTICGQNSGNQVGCQLGGSSPWTLSPTYTGAASGVRTWTGDNSCAVAGTTTSAASNAAWLAESIVNGGTPAGVYSYPNTSMTAWLCQSVDQSAGACVGGNSHGQGGDPQDSCPNNSTSQAEIYYAKLTSDPNNPPQAPYNIYAVQNCAGPEGVDSPTSVVPALNNIDGGDAIEADMIKQCVKH
jgi:hypothetical protein